MHQNHRSERMEHGHYTATVMDDVTRKWYVFDDDRNVNEVRP